MHQSALKAAQAFRDTYVIARDKKNVLDLGSLDVNGSLRPLFPEPEFLYTGIDQVEGPNVDRVCSNHDIDFPTESFDYVLSSSCFEHDEMFWITFLEMCRVCKNNGYIYINAPSNGPYHAYPVDCWRFYKDSWAALAKWAAINGYNVQCLSGTVDHNSKHLADSALWEDSVGIF